MLNNAQVFEEKSKKTCAFATASIILSIISPLAVIFSVLLAALFGIIAIVLGIIAIVKIGKNSSELGGTGIAIAGICIPLVLLPVASYIKVLSKALDLAYEQGSRVVSMANLTTIGEKIIEYAQDHDSRFPLNLQVLVDEYELSPRMLDFHRKPEDFTGPSYIYIPDQNQSMDVRNILVYENPEFCVHMISVLYVDGYAEWIRKDEFLRKLEITYKYLDKEMPEIHFAEED